MITGDQSQREGCSSSACPLPSGQVAVSIVLADRCPSSRPQRPSSSHREARQASSSDRGRADARVVCHAILPHRPEDEIALFCAIAGNPKRAPDRASADAAGVRDAPRHPKGSLRPAWPEVFRTSSPDRALKQQLLDDLLDLLPLERLEALAITRLDLELQTAPCSLQWLSIIMPQTFAEASLTRRPLQGYSLSCPNVNGRKLTAA